MNNNHHTSIHHLLNKYKILNVIIYKQIIIKILDLLIVLINMGIDTGSIDRMFLGISNLYRFIFLFLFTCLVFIFYFEYFR
jgi:hypothetical protein